MVFLDQVGNSSSAFIGIPLVGCPFQKKTLLLRTSDIQCVRFFPGAWGFRTKIPSEKCHTQAPYPGKWMAGTPRLWRWEWFQWFSFIHSSHSLKFMFRVFPSLTCTPALENFALPRYPCHFAGLNRCPESPLDKQPAASPPVVHFQKSLRRVPSPKNSTKTRKEMKYSGMRIWQWQLHRRSITKKSQVEFSWFTKGHIWHINKVGIARTASTINMHYQQSSDRCVTTWIKSRYTSVNFHVDTQNCHMLINLSSYCTLTNFTPFSL